MTHHIESALPDGATLRVAFLDPAIARVTFLPRAAKAETGLNRYGFIVEPCQGVSARAERDKEKFSVSTDAMTTRWDGSVLEVLDPSGGILLRQESVALDGGMGRARFRAHEGEDWAGFGDQTRERLFHRGHLVDLRVTNVTSYIPVPFFMSTRGVGTLINSTHRVTLDMAKSDPDAYSWRDGRTAVDYYVMVAGSFRGLIDLYTRLTGRPKLPPEWAFGLWYICRTQANDFEAVSDALNFRREGIPCDALGLEPGWMETFYDASTEKDWSKQRFPIPTYCRTGPHNFFNAIQRMGFHMALWLCNEYDLSYEAERQAVATGNAPEEKPRPVFHKEAEVDEHFAAERPPDRITKPDEPWFKHLEKFVDQGIEFFKQDGAYQVLNHPGRVWGNGMLDDEMHNLYPLLYARQMHEGYAEYTGRRPVVFTVAGWAGFQAWCGTWTGDTGGRLDTLGGMLNTSMVGHAWCTNDMEVAEKEGVHFGYLQPWSQINSWTYFRMPWIQGEDLAAMHRDYARLRSRLVPYLYCWARHATETGYPVLAPLALEFEGDPECRDNLHQYLLGRDLLVSVYRREVYFPEGRWKDFWTGEVVEGGARREIDWPANRGGGLHVREGGIVPLGPTMQFRGQKPVDPVDLYVFPAERETELEYYEDDGRTLAHERGEFSVTRIRARRCAEGATVKIDPAQGSFEGQATQREWGFIVAADSRPAQVVANGTALRSEAWSYDAARREIRIEPVAGPVDLAIQG